MVKIKNSKSINTKKEDCKTKKTVQKEEGFLFWWFG